MSADLFPELGDERARLAFARLSRDRMIARLSAVDPEGAADEFTSDYIEVTVAHALEDLSGPGAGDFFGRIDCADDRGGSDRWYIGRRHIEDEAHDPVVVDWRAAIAAPFYRATAVDPLGVDFRRRFTLDEGDIVAYLDEQLDDPDSADVIGGIPDPVLAEIGAQRSGEMREIVATIQGEQDIVIRSPIDQVLIVQGGPGTGKTAVALHRVAYLMFEHRSRLGRDGVLVVGPNKAFLDYIGNVLPSLGERRVRQATVDELCIPRVDVAGLDDTELARWKGDGQRLVELREAAFAAISAPPEDVLVPIGARTHVFGPGEIEGWLETAKGGTSPINELRTRVQALAKRELLRRTGNDGDWAKAGPLKSAINKAWPNQKPIKLVDKLLPGPGGKRRVWTRADQLLVDEANSMLNGSPFTYGHVVVDEAQDHSAVALRVIGRRSPSMSMTLVGDVAQSTTPAGQERWADVFVHLNTTRIKPSRTGPTQQTSAEQGMSESGPGPVDGIVADLTIGYRVPEPILEVANRLLPLTGVEATASRSVRKVGEPPQWSQCDQADLPAEVARATKAMKARHKLTGIVAPVEIHDALAVALVNADLVGADHVHDLERDQVPVFSPEAVKGLEFDGVIVVNPHEILSAGADPQTTADYTPRGARLLYVAMTRAVQEVHFVTDSSAPQIISSGDT